MALTQTIPTPSKPIATFPSEEIASGLGNVDFLGIAENKEGTVSYKLTTNNSIFSRPTTTERTAVGTTEMNFDTSIFNLPRTAKGTAIFSCGVSGAGTTDTSKITVQLIHVDSGATETIITSEITSDTFTIDSGVGQFILLFLPITEKHFKKGDLLRLEVKMIKVTGTQRIEIGHDPKNEDGTSLQPSGVGGGTTVMTLVMPFRSDI